MKSSAIEKRIVKIDHVIAAMNVAKNIFQIMKKSKMLF